MKIFTTSSSAQTFDVIPRTFASTYTMKLRDTSKNKEVFSASVSASDVTNHKRVSATISPVLKEGRYYDLSLLSGSSVVYKDRIFCTDQTINQTNNNYYDINSGLIENILYPALDPSIFEIKFPNSDIKGRVLGDNLGIVE